jgi:hypothetical protein
MDMPDTDQDRRAFIKKMVVLGAFAGPVVSTFALGSQGVASANHASNVSHGSNVSLGSNVALGSNVSLSTPPAVSGSRSGTEAKELAPRDNR